MEPKSSKMRSWKHLVSRVAPGSILERFWDHIGTTLVSSFLTYCLLLLHAFFSNTLQTKTFRITGNHKNNAAESFQETAPLFVPSCIEKLASEHKVAFRSLLVQVETRQISTIATGRCPVLILYICLVSTADICPVSAADICPVSTADICPVSTEDIYPVSTEDI